MALSNPNTTIAANSFETEDETNGQATVTAQAEAVAVGVTAEAPAAQAVAVVQPRTSALAVPRPNAKAALLAQNDVLAGLKNAMPVTWENFSSIQANQGKFGVKNDNKSAGEVIELRLVSWQDLFVSSPHDIDAEGDGLVKYSDDGIVATDEEGTLLADHQAMLKAQGFDDAGIDHKIVLVGELVSAGDGCIDEIGNLVQVVLPATGRRSFDSHCKQSAFHITENRLQIEDVEYVKLTAKLAGTGKKSFTQVVIGYAEGHKPSQPVRKV